MRPAFAAGCAAAAVLLSAVACATPTAEHAPASQSPAGQAAARPVTASTIPGCPTRRAYATKVTSAGHVAWQDSLPTDPVMEGIVLQPLVFGRVAVFAEENAVYGIRLSDGRRLWRRAFSATTASPSGTVYGLWASGGHLIVLIGQVSKNARLIELNPSTGAVGWTLRLPPAGLLGSQALGSDGTLAVLLPNGTLESIDLVKGRVLWKRHVGTSAGPAAVGPVLAAGGAGDAVGYRARGAGSALWTTRGLPPQTNLTAADGLFLAWSNTGGGNSPTAVTAVNPRTGRVAWRFDPHMGVTILGSGPAGIALATYFKRELYLVNPAAGQARWSAATFAAAGFGIPGDVVVTGGQVAMAEAGIAAPPASTRLVVRRASSGRVLWSTPLGTAGSGGVNLAVLPLPGGPALAAALPASTGLTTRLTVSRLATGARLGSVTLPDMVVAPLTVAGTSILAQSDAPACGTPTAGTARARTASVASS